MNERAIQASSFTSVHRAYIAGDDAVTRCFSGGPRALWDAAPVTRTIDSALAAEIDAFNRGLNHSIPDLSGPLSIIATGHQPTLLTGPLYTVYKAITAIQAANRLQERYGVNVAALFWIAGDDHDLDEACTVHVLTKRDEPHALTYQPQSDMSGRALDNVTLDATVQSLVADAASVTYGSELRAEIQAALQDTLAASTSMTDWTARLLARLFADTPLVLFVPSLPRSRHVAAAIMRTEIEQPLESTRLVNQAGDGLRVLGYVPQVVKGATDCNFFFEEDGLRRKVTYEDGRFVVNGTDKSHTRDEMLAVLNSSPERFSPNVILRCIVQQQIFPTAAYVGGPGEIAYWAQLKPVFAHFGLSMPIVYPRASAVLTTMKLNKLLNKFKLSPEELTDDPDDVLERALAAESGDGISREIAEKRTAIDGVLTELTRLVEQRAAKATDAAARLTERTAAEFEKFERAVLRADERRVETARQQIMRLCNVLAPMRKPQERVYTVFSYLFEHGWDLIPRLARELNLDEFNMQNIEL